MVKNKTKKLSSNEIFDDLYISMNNSIEKRKNILSSIKNSLIMQDEYEKIFQIKSNKDSIISEIKKEMNALNSDYQKLKKLLPNIRNVLSYTEKELEELDNEIGVLKSEIKIDNEKINQRENLSNSIIKGNLKSKGKNKIIKKGLEKPVKKPVQKKEKLKVEKKLTKIERIKNNLKVIESKLNSL